MNKNILIIHGWDSSPQEHWFPKIKGKLEKDDYQVFIPEMPGAYFPKKDEWVKIIANYNIDDKWILIGHSLGGVVILKYLEIAPKPISKVILIATPYEAMDFHPIADFFGKGFNWPKIKKNCPKFEILNEDADPAVPLSDGKKFAKRLHSKLHIVKGYTHFHILDLDFLEKLIKT